MREMTKKRKAMCGWGGFVNSTSGRLRKKKNRNKNHFNFACMGKRIKRDPESGMRSDCAKMKLKKHTAEQIWHMTMRAQGV